MVAGTDGVTKDWIKCYGCQNYGHYQDKCPESNKEITNAQQDGTQPPPEEEEIHMNEEIEMVDIEELSDDGSVIVNFQHFYDSFEDAKKRRIKDGIKSGKYTTSDILIDTGSTCSVFNNSDMLLDIKKTGEV